MKMKIYADVLIVTNCLTELVYLQTAAKLTHRRLNKGRLCAACLFGGLLSLLFFADGGTFIGALLITIAKFTGVILTLVIAAGFGNAGSFFRCTVVWLAVRVAYTGIIIIYWELSDSRIIYVRNYTTYFDISLLRLTAALITAYILLTLYEMITRHIRKRSDQYEAIYRSGDYEVRLPAIADTGNRLCDSFTGLPVVIFCCDDMYCHYSLDDPAKIADKGFRLTPYTTINGNGLISVTSKGKVTITDSRGNESEIRCCVGIRPSDRDHSRAIFDPTVLE